MAESTSSGTYEERPKVNWFLWVAAGFFVILLLAIWELPNGTMKWAWVGIAVLNLSANALQINNTRVTRYVLWKRGLSIYVGKNREALIRFDKALMFRPFKGTKDAKEDLRAFSVQGSLRAYPIFGSRRRWLVIFERDDGVVQGLVFDPSPRLEGLFRNRLFEAEAEHNDAEDAEGIPETQDETPPQTATMAHPALEGEEWTEDDNPRPAGTREETGTADAEPEDGGPPR